MRRAALMALGIGGLVAGVAGGLLRAGVQLPGSAPVLETAATAHAALMLCGFLGTLIAIERAVALRVAAAWAAPLAAGAGTVALLVGAAHTADVLFGGAAIAYAAVHATVSRRQPGPASTILVLAALAWLAGTVAHALGAVPVAVHACWFAFPVLTIAAERLELARPRGGSRAASWLLHAIVAALLAAAALCGIAPAAGTLAFGASLLALAAWLARFDAARRTLRIAGLGRYMAIATLAGFAWLAVAGVGWIALALGASTRDAALHALGIGFVLGMVLAHGPMILPAVLRVRVAFRAWLYVPLVVLHASLLLRLDGATIDPAWRTLGAIGNAVALALYALAMLGGALAARRAALDDRRNRRRADRDAQAPSPLASP